MADPISEIVNDQPTPAVISTVTDAGAYQPGEDNPPGPPEISPVIGFFSGEKENNANYEARYLIRAVDKPSHLRAGSKLTTGGIDYNVLKVRTRRWEGVVNGYSLELGR
jgi:hypothetical protein